MTDRQSRQSPIHSNGLGQAATALFLGLLLFTTACGGGGGSSTDAATDPTTTADSGSGTPSAVQRSWSGPVSLAPPNETSPFQDTDPTLLVDATGTVTALWYRYDGTAVSLYSSRRASKGAWSTPELAEATDTDAVCTSAEAYCTRPTPAVIDAAGNVTVVWPRRVGGQWLLAANRYLPGLGWGDEVHFDTAPPLMEPANYQVAVLSRENLLIDDQGRVTVIWPTLIPCASCSDYIQYSYAQFDGTHWTTGTLETSRATGDLVRWGIDPVSGKVTFSWLVAVPGGGVEVRARTFSPNSGWDAEHLLLTLAAPWLPDSITIVSDRLGAFTVLATVRQNLVYPNGALYRVNAIRREADGTWGSAVAINSNIDSTGVKDFQVPQAVAGPQGELTVVTGRARMSDSADLWYIYRNTWSPTGGWSPSQFEMQTAGFGSSWGTGRPGLVGTDDGGAFVLNFRWRSYTYGYAGAVFGYYHPTPGGAAEEMPLYEAADEAADARYAISPTGYAAVAFSTYAGLVKVQRYVPGRGWLPLETIASLAPPEAARPGVNVDSVSISPSGHIFVAYYDVDYEAYAGVHFDPASGWGAPGFLAGHSSRLVGTTAAVHGVKSIIEEDGEAVAVINTRAGGTGLEAFEGKGSVDTPYTTTVLPRTAPTTSTPTSGTGGSCSGTNSSPPQLGNYIDQNFSYIRACGATEVQLGTLIDGADVYYDAYRNAITNLGCTEDEAAPTYNAHRETALLAKRAADTYGCTR